jgi:hypothetical protein
VLPARKVHKVYKDLLERKVLLARKVRKAHRVRKVLREL